jgi:hypothetical protein
MLGGAWRKEKVRYVRRRLQARLGRAGLGAGLVALGHVSGLSVVGPWGLMRLRIAFLPSLDDIQSASVPRLTRPTVLLPSSQACRRMTCRIVSDDIQRYLSHWRPQSDALTVSSARNLEFSNNLSRVAWG